MIRVVVLLVLLPLLVACSGDEGDEEPVVAVSPTPFPTSIIQGTPSAERTPVPDGSPETPWATGLLKGVFKEPQPEGEVVQAELPERPASPFSAWDGTSVVVYDTQSDEEHDFGPGSLGSPAFGEEFLVYTVDNREVFVVDLATMESRFLTRGVLAYVLGDEHVVVNPGDNEFVVINVRTGNRVDPENLTDPLLKSRAAQRWGGAFLGEWLSERFAIRQLENPGQVCEKTGAEQRACLAEASEWWLIEDLWGLEVKLVLEAIKVEPAGGVYVAMATVPVCEEAGKLTRCFDVLAKLEAQNPGDSDRLSIKGTTNIFLVDVLSGEATFVATATYNAATGEWPINWPLVASKQYVAWTESYCGEPAGRTRIYDRETGSITELGASEWLVAAENGLGIGERGASAVIDPKTLDYLAVLPELASVSWSSDLRYAAVGQGIVRSGVCQ